MILKTILNFFFDLIKANNKKLYCINFNPWEQDLTVSTLIKQKNIGNKSKTIKISIKM